MKILTILASKRNLGNSDIALKTAKKALSVKGIEAVDINLSNLNIKQCQGCLACIFKGRCALDDDMHLLLDNLIEADGLIIAAPTYIMSPVGIIKMILDRALMVVPHLPLINGKLRYALTITVAGSPLWNPMGREILNQLAIAYQYKIFDAIEAFSPGPAEVLLNEELMNDIKTKTNAMVEALLTSEIVKHSNQNICPNCLGKVFKMTDNGPICPVCLNTAEINDGQVYFNSSGKHFFTSENLLQHTQEWIIPSKQKFLEKRIAIKEKLIQEGYKK